MNGNFDHFTIEKTFNRLWIFSHRASRDSLVKDFKIQIAFKITNATTMLHVALYIYMHKNIGNFKRNLYFEIFNN